VKGAATIRGLFSLPAAGTATAAKGFDSQAEKMTASAFNKGTGTAVTQNFQWQAEPVDNNTSTASGSLNLLFGQGTNKLAETGLNIASNGQISFATGQTFPGTGDGTITGVTTATGSGLIGGGTSGTLDLSLTNACATNQVLQWNGTSWVCTAVGTITGVTAGTDLTGGGTSGNVTLSLNTSATNALYARLAAANTFTANQTVNGSLLANSNGSLGLWGESNATTGTAAGVYGTASSSSGYGVEGTSPNVGVYGTGTSSSSGYGVEGTAPSVGVYGLGTSSNIQSVGVLGRATDTGGDGTYGVYGTAAWTGVIGAGTGTDTTTFGVWGTVGSGEGVGIYGQNLATTGDAGGVYGTSASTSGYGVEGTSPNIGVYGQTGDTTSNTGSTLAYGAGLWGDAGTDGSIFFGVKATGDDTYAGVFVNNSGAYGTLYAENDTKTSGATAFVAAMPELLGATAYAVIGDAGCGSGFMALQLDEDGMSGCNNYTLMGGNTGNDTYLNANADGGIHLRLNNVEQVSVTTGKVDVIGTLSKGGGSFKIDHPLDPANKYLYHSFVESPDMMNIYNGNVTTDASGEATVQLPEWFETLNRDFRYQLTVIGQFAQAIVAGKVANHHFVIKTDKPNVEVSWQVTGIRQDAFANAHRIQVEVEKDPADRGHYLYPELVGAPKTAAIGYMAPAPGSEQIVHKHPAIPRRGNASPLQQRTPPILPIRPRPVPPNVPPLPHPVAKANKLEVNQK